MGKRRCGGFTCFLARHIVLLLVEYVTFCTTPKLPVPRGVSFASLNRACSFFASVKSSRGVCLPLVLGFAISGRKKKKKGVGGMVVSLDLHSGPVMMRLLPLLQYLTLIDLQLCVRISRKTFNPRVGRWHDRVPSVPGVAHVEYCRDDGRDRSGNGGEERRTGGVAKRKQYRGGRVSQS